MTLQERKQALREALKAVHECQQVFTAAALSVYEGRCYEDVASEPPSPMNTAYLNLIEAKQKLAALKQGETK